MNCWNRPLLPQSTERRNSLPKTMAKPKVMPWPTKKLTLLSALAAAVGLAPAHGTEFPEGIEYSFQAQSYPQYQSNPFRFSRADKPQHESDVVMVNGVRAAAIIPLLSERTRLDVSGTVNDANYAHYDQLDHQAKRLDTTLRWHAGDLFNGRVDYMYDDRLYNYLNRTFPNRDMVQTDGLSVQAGMRITENLELPVITLNQAKVDYETPDNRTLYNRNADGWQAAFVYSGHGNSFLRGGIRQENVYYRDRTPFWTDLIDNRYRDREVFIGGQWDYSAKTTFGARVGYLQRQYSKLSERDERLLTLDLKAGWDYSVKTRFDLNAWRRPYANDDSPTTLYSTVTGVRGSVRYKATDKTRLSLNLVAENQKDTPIAGATGNSARLYRGGVRMEWAARDNMLVVLDAYHDRTDGRNESASYRQNVARLGVVFSFDNNGRAARLLWNPECEPPKYVEASYCDN